MSQIHHKKIRRPDPNKVSDTAVSWLLYSIIAVSSALALFFYTDRYSGWGHYYANAVPMAFGMSIIAPFIAAMVVAEMSHRKMRVTLIIVALFWSLLASGLYVFAPVKTQANGEQGAAPNP